MALNIYLSGEIHTDWRQQIIAACAAMDVQFFSPVTDHEASDDCVVEIGQGRSKFWHDHKGAKINAIRTRKAIADADIVVVRFGDKYKQWNRLDANMRPHGKSLIVMHAADHQYALKEVDAAALAVVETVDQIVAILRYVLEGKLGR